MSLNKVGDVLQRQGDLNGAVAGYREGLEIVRDLAAKDPSNTTWQSDVVISLDYLARAGDDPRGRWSEALAMLARLKSQNRLSAAQQGWIGRVEVELAKFDRADLVLSPKVEQIQGTYDGTNTVNQVSGEHQISLTFQQSGTDVAATYEAR